MCDDTLWMSQQSNRANAGCDKRPKGIGDEREMPRQKSNKASDDMRRIVHGHVRSMSHALAAPTGAHLDEDALSVFVEGRMSDSESAPVVRHLVACASCRRITSELIRLDSALAETPQETPLIADEPGRMRRLLEGLAARVLPSTDDDVVFAYHAPADDFEKKSESPDGEETKGADPDGGNKD